MPSKVKAISQVNVSREMWRMVVREDIDSNGIRVLFFLLGSMKAKDLVVVNRAEIEHKLKISSQAVDRSIKKLVELKIFIEDENEKMGVCQRYRLNPEYGWAS